MKNKPKKQKTEKVPLLLAVKIDKAKLLGWTCHETYSYANLPKNYLNFELEKGVDVKVYKCG